jgi:thiamine kinase-like enzyme
VLVRGGQVYPVDWESAAIAAGEIDLASLTEKWPADIVRQLERDYQQARWPAGAPASFAQTLAAARLYLHLRWLGDRPSWTSGERESWRFDHLRSAGEQLGLI